MLVNKKQLGLTVIWFVLLTGLGLPTGFWVSVVRASMIVFLGLLGIYLIEKHA